jgi:hypothetical protein
MHGNTPPAAGPETEKSRRTSEGQYAAGQEQSAQAAAAPAAYRDIAGWLIAKHFSRSQVAIHPLARPLANLGKCETLTRRRHGLLASRRSDETGARLY